MARANPYLRSLRIFDPDVDLAIDEEPVGGKGKKSAKTSEDFMMDPLLSLSEESTPVEEGPAARPAPGPKTRETPPPADSGFDEELGGKVVEL